MYEIETLASDNQLWFQDHLYELIKNKYKAIHINTLISIDGKLIWTAVLEKEK